MSAQQSDKNAEKKSQAAAEKGLKKESGSEFTPGFEDKRPEVLQRRSLQQLANNSVQSRQAAQLQAMADTHTSKRWQPIQKKANTTGLPDQLKSGIENLSGYSMDDVKVNYNSSKPAQLQAHAYAQGTDIHLAPGQEKHLPHEAWHVVQQKQGRVNPTMQLKGKVNVNDDDGLEREADVMGAKALHNMPPPIAISIAANDSPHVVQRNALFGLSTVPLHHASTIQRMEDEEYEGLSHAWGKATVDTALLHLGKSKAQASRDETFHQLTIDTDNIMNAVVGTEVDEMQHGAQDGSDFTTWLDTGDKPAEMNCWEYVLYMGVQFGVLTREELATKYNDGGRYEKSENIKPAFDNGLQAIDADDMGALSIGDAIVVGRVDRHVLISLGGAFVADLGSWTAVTITTLDRVMASQNNNSNMAFSDFSDKLAQRDDLFADRGSDEFQQECLQQVFVFQARDPRASMAEVRQWIDDRMAACNVSAGNRDIIRALFNEGAPPAYFRIPVATWSAAIQE